MHLQSHGFVQSLSPCMQMKTNEALSALNRADSAFIAIPVKS